LWSDSLYGQIGWLLAFALLGVPATIKKDALARGSMQRSAYVFWVALFLTTAGSSALAATTTDIPVHGRARACRTDRYRLYRHAARVFAQAGLAAMAAARCRAAEHRNGDLPHAGVRRRERVDHPHHALFAALAFALLAKPAKRRTMLVSICLLIALQAGPFYWSLTATLYPPVNVTMPFAGPELYENLKTPGMTAHQEPYTGPETDLCGLEDYLVEHYREGTYLVVSQRANDVAGLIIDTGLPAVAYGGFLGWDGAISLDELKVLVDEGVVTYFLVPSSMMGRSTSELTSYAAENARLIPASEYGGSSSFGQLYLFE
jgi:4-amino-4-deoxy-L-arabinose transferase-like glycosyltransferase